MLGKGLESLIPQKGNSGRGNAQEPAAVPSTTPAPAPTPVSEPVAQAAPPPVEAALPSGAPQEPMMLPTELAAPPSEAFMAAFKNVPSPVSSESIFHIEVEKIQPNPDQPRRNFDEAALRDLASSIREFGFLQPLVVSKIEIETPTGIDVAYELIAGERRFLAAKMLGLSVVPAIVRRVDLEREKLELAVIENIQRENLNPIETARAFQKLQEEFRMTQREIASKLGKSRETVANATRLLDLPEYLQAAVQEGKLSESHGRFLLGVADPGAQKRLYEDIITNRLTTRDVKERVHQAAAASPAGPRRGRPPKSAEHLAPELRAIQDSLSMELGAPVEIHKGSAKGSITITFYSDEELEGIMRRIGREE